MASRMSSVCERVDTTGGCVRLKLLGGRGVFVELKGEGCVLRREAVQVQLGGLRVAIRAFRRADAPLPQAHRREAVQVPALRPMLLPQRSPSPAHEETREPPGRAAGGQREEKSRPGTLITANSLNSKISANTVGDNRSRPGEPPTRGWGMGCRTGEESSSDSGVQLA
ncbi:hypothetical protein WN48_09294 [Eufriesea mexicana]|uniref:Uncharacterized protein n=1 Tax=Eufriesea mexicana TaxID=516756 RepID=A0A310SJX0_9HYME|nr:hypothetical protein WN48_09294 [Eufriesea mexicana]